MYRRDYILRLIERFARALILLRDRLLRRERQGVEAVAMITEVASEAGVDLDLARRLDPASLLLWLAPGDDVDEPKLWLVAELLYLSGLELRETDFERAHADLTRARAVFHRLPPSWRPTPEFPTASDRVSEIDALL